VPRRMSRCDSRQPHQPSLYELRLGEPIFFRPCASLRDRVSKTQFARGSTEAACQLANRNLKWKILRGRGRKVMRLPCKQADAGALPADSTISSRGTRLKHREKPHKLLQVGVIPTPATSLR
jgi:hypothetical protein